MAGGRGEATRPNRLVAARMTDSIWQLYRTNDLGEWKLVGNFDRLAAAARRIIDIEAVPVGALSFEMHVSADQASDDEVLGHLEYKGKHGSYVIKRQQH